jgi:hypothetical protein
MPPKKAKANVVGKGIRVPAKNKGANANSFGQVNQVSSIVRTDLLFDLKAEAGFTGCRLFGVPAQFTFLREMCRFYTEYRWRSVAFEIIFMDNPAENGRIVAGFARDPELRINNFQDLMGMPGTVARTFASLGSSSMKLKCPFVDNQWRHTDPDPRHYWDGSRGGYLLPGHPDVPWVFHSKLVTPNKTSHLAGMLRIKYHIDFRNPIHEHLDGPVWIPKQDEIPETG